MPKYYCDYCDVFLTHDSTSVRKAHNSGRNHIQNVRDYYAAMGHDKAQDIIDQITKGYANGGPPGGGMGMGMGMGMGGPSGPPPMRMGPGFMGAPGPGGLPPQGMMGGMGGPPMMNGGFRPPPNGQPPFFQQQPPPNTSHLGHHQPLPQQNLPFRPPPFQQNGVASPYGGPPPQNGYGVSPSQYTPQQPPHMAGGPGFGGSPGGYRPPQPNFGTPPPSSGPAGGAPGFAEQAAPYTPGGGAGLRINPDRLRMLGSGGQ